MSQTIFITGANRGIGLEFCCQYLASGNQVIATCRAPVSATALSALQADYDQLQVHALDITDWDAIDSLATQLADTPIDILINNAGTAGPSGFELFSGKSAEDWMMALRTNILGAYKIAEAFANHLATSNQKKLVTIGSRKGSISHNDAGKAYAYRSSKAGLHAVCKSLAIDLAPQGITSVVLHPGFVKTDMTGNSGLVTATESVNGMIDIIENLNEKDNGRFMRFDKKDDITW